MVCLIGLSIVSLPKNTQGLRVLDVLRKSKESYIL